LNTIIISEADKFPVVYDQDNYNIHLASSADCGTNLVAIGKGADAVPNLAGSCTAPSYERAPIQTAVLSPVVSSVVQSTSSKTGGAVATPTPKKTTSRRSTGMRTATRKPTGRSSTVKSVQTMK
jgi:hypothetical protein